MELLAAVIERAEGRYRFDWADVRNSVRQRLRAVSPLVTELMDPHRYPTYWCVPLLVGDYVGADRDAILDDLIPYVAGCVVRHVLFDPSPNIGLPVDDELVQLISTAYAGCRDVGGSFDVRFTAKCQPWSVLLSLGTESIRAATEATKDCQTALRAIVAVFACVQILDDWHDRDDDLARGHWNIWADEPIERTLTAVKLLVGGAWGSVSALRPHLLRDALIAQLRDATRELTDLSELHRRPMVPNAAPAAAQLIDAAVASGVHFLRGRLGTSAAGLWRDFSSPGLSYGSTECVSAFIATLLAPIPEGRPLARAVSSTLLAKARPSGGWGYREDVPEDCDSTAWVLLAATTADVTAPPGLIRRSQEFIVTHQRTGGGFATYNDAARAALTPADQPGWFAPEPSVTCSAALALAATKYPDASVLRNACAFVADRYTLQGWSSYWWLGLSYGTFVATWALSALSDGLHDEKLSSAHRAMITRRGAGTWATAEGDPDGFVTALAVLTLLRGPLPPDPGVLASSTALLIGLQEPSGRWPPNAQMLAPGAHFGVDLVLRDELVTTACAVAALHAIRTSQVAISGVSINRSRNASPGGQDDSEGSG
jgi:hypothetical protein